MTTIAQLPPYPNGWYALGFSDELPRGGVLTRPLAGQDVVLFRTASGQVCAIDPFCPHLGAHLGHGGKVIGETINCPFHDFRFDTEGVCIATGYGTKPPPKARLRTWHVRENHGILLVYFDAGHNAPAWEVPQLDPTGWTLPLARRQWRLRSHPQETSENSVDIGHLRAVHGYHGVEMRSELRTEGTALHARYAMQRPLKLLGRTLMLTRTEFNVHVYGLGFSFVEVTVQDYGIHARLFVLSTPVDAQHVHLRVATSAQKVTDPAQVHAALRYAPPTLVNAALSRGVLFGLAHDVGQDFAIWENKVYLSPPALAEGDGPVGRYRQWARQFYSAPAGVLHGQQPATDGSVEV